MTNFGAVSTLKKPRVASGVVYGMGGIYTVELAMAILQVGTAIARYVASVCEEGGFLKSENLLY
jgi:hypothetical protein